jgi:NB-ARC domain
VQKSLIAPIGSTDPSLVGGTAGTKNSFEMVYMDVSFEVTRGDPQLPCFSLGPHQQSEDFFPRDDILKEIDAVLLPPALAPETHKPETLRSYALCGMGGMGKTSIAVQYAQQRKKHFEAVFWLTAGEPSILAESFAGVAKLLGLEQPGEKSDLNASRDRVKGWLENSVRSFNPINPVDNDVRWLLIFDNVEKLEVLENYWPTTGHGSILVTSRDPEAKRDTFSANMGMDLQPLKKESSMEFLQARTKLRVKPSQRAALEQVVEKLGGLPYALDQMAGLIKRLRVSYSDLIELYEKEGIQQLEKMQSGSTEPGKWRSFITVWALESLSETTMGLLQILSLLDPDRIPERILTEGCPTLSISGCPKSLGEYIIARAELLQTSLIHQNQDLKQLSLHRLL